MARKDGRRAKAAGRQPLVEELESRLLFSADAAALVADATLVVPVAEAMPAQEVVLVDEAPAGDQGVAAESLRHELVFVDAGVEGYEALLEDLRAGSGDSRSLEVVVLDPDRSGIEQISEALASHRHDLDAVHIVSHGTEGEVQLGDAWLSNGNVGQHAQAIAGWGTALAADADLLFYGCNLAGSTEGLSLVNSLSALTGADVAASTDTTGAAIFGGDWRFEHSVGSVETDVAFSAELQQSWNHVMATTIDNSTSGSTTDQLSVTVSHLTSGTNRLMLVGVSMQPEGESVASVTYNGVSLTLLGVEENPGGKSRVEIWQLVAPDTGTHDVVVTMTGTGHKGVTVGVMTFNGVDQTTPTLAFSSASGDSTAATVDVTSQADDLVFGVVQSHKGTAVGQGAGQTEHWDIADNNANGSGSVEAGAASVTTSYTVNNDKWSVAGVSVQADTNSVESASLSVVQDSYIQLGNPTTNAGSSGSMIIDREDGDLQRALVQFDLSSVPAGSTITSATLKLQATTVEGLLTIEAYQLLESWVEGSTTWNERSSGSGWSTTGGTFNATALDSLTTDATGVHGFDITALAQDWVDGTEQNYGVLVASPDGGGNRRVFYDSREGSVVPVLEIFYEPANVAPVIAVASPLAYTENDGAVVIDGTATATDADGLDFDTGTLTVDFTANGTANDRLSIRNQGTGAGQVGVSGSNVSYEGTVVGTFVGGTNGSDPLVVTFDVDADEEAVQAVLRNVTYENVSEDPSTSARTLRFVLTDGDTGTSNTETVTVNVTAQNDPPALANNSLTIDEGQTVVLGSGDLLSNDLDHPATALTYTVSGVTGGQFELVAAPGSPITNFTQDDIDTAKVRFVHFGGEAAPTYSVTVDDGSLSDGPQAATITFNNLNDAPTVDDLDADTLAYFEGSGPLVIDQGAAALVSDPDSANFDGGELRLSIVAGNDPTEDVLSIQDVGTGAGQIGFSGGIVSYEGTPIGTAVGGSGGADLVISLNASATPTAVSALARNITFENTDAVAATLGSRTVEFRFDDGDTGLTIVDTTVTVFNSNVAPTITGAVASQAVNDNATRDPFTGVTIGDADVPSQSLTVTVTLDAAAKGVLTNLGSFVDLGGGAYRFTGDAAAATTAIRALTFDPTENRVAVGGSETTTFTISVTDGIAPQVDNTTTSVDSTSINDAPTLGNGALTAVLEDTTSPPGATVASLFGAGFSDVDVSAAFSGVAIVGNAATAGEGVWEYSSDGTNWFAVATVDDAGSALAVDAASRLRFVPASDFNGVPTDLVVRGLDETHAGFSTTSSGESRVTVNTSAPGGSTPITAATSTLSTSITADNDAPVVGFNSLTISEGGTVVLATADLSTTDVDSPATALTYTVSGLSGGQFEFVAAPGSPITTFTQDDVDTGKVRFVHDGGEAAPAYSVSVSDGFLADGPVAAAITFSNVNDAPSIATNALTISEGGTVVLGSGDLSTADVDSAATALTYTVTAVTGGQFELVAAPGSPITSFTQDDVDTGKVQFVHAGGEAAPTYSLSVSDGFLVDGPVAATITFSNVNDAPTLGANALTITEGGTVLLGAGSLSATDPDDTAASLSFTVSGVSGGQFERVSVPGVAITSFLQGEVTTGDIRFIHDGGEAAPAYSVSVSDGFLSDGPAAAAITFSNVNDAPSITTKSLTVAEGQTVVLGSGDLATTDVDSPATALTYTVSGVSGGQFELVAAPGTSITSFTQDDVDTGKVQFVHDGGEAAPAYNVAVFDGGLSDGPVAATISFSNVNDAPTITGAAGGQGLTDKATLTPFTGVTIADVDLPADTLTVDVILDDAAKGVLTGAFTDLGGGVYRFTGDAASATTALQGLTFDPTENRVAVGSTETTTFTIQVDDGSAPQVSDANTSAVATSMNDAPTVSDVNLVIAEDAPAGALLGSVVASDPDPGDALGYSFLSGNLGGAFAIDPATGAITVADPAAIDFEVNPAFNLTVQVQDGSLATDTAAANVAVSDVTEVVPPPDGGLPDPDPIDDPGPDDDPAPEDEGEEQRVDVAAPPSQVNAPLVAPPSGLALGSQERDRSDVGLAYELAQRLRTGGDAGELLTAARLGPAGDGFAVDGALMRALDLMGIDMGATAEEEQQQLRLVLGVAEGGAAAMLAGFLTWFLRGGTLLTSLLSTLPIWSRIDPLPVLNVASANQAPIPQDDQDEEEREAGRILDDSQIPDADPMGPMPPGI